MSKAFTREDDDAGFEAPKTAAPPPAAVILRVVEVRPKKGGATRLLRIVAGDATTVEGGCSAASPLGRALIDAGEGDVVEVCTPRGPEKLVVLALEVPREGPRAPLR